MEDKMTLQFRIFRNLEKSNSQSVFPPKYYISAASPAVAVLFSDTTHSKVDE